MRKSVIIASTILICHSLEAVAGRDWEDLPEVARYDVVSNLVCRHSEDFVALVQCRADELYHMKEWADEEKVEPLSSFISSNGGRRFRVMKNLMASSGSVGYGYIFDEPGRFTKLGRCPRVYRPVIFYSAVTYFAVMRRVQDVSEIVEGDSSSGLISPAVENGVAYKLVPGCCFEVEAEPYQIRMEGWPDIEKKRVENIISSHERMVSTGRKGSYVALVRLSKRELSEAIYCLFGKRRYNELLSGGGNPYLIEVAGGIPETQFARDIYSAMKAKRAKKGKK